MGSAPSNDLRNDREDFCISMIPSLKRLLSSLEVLPPVAEAARLVTHMCEMLPRIKQHESAVRILICDAGAVVFTVSEDLSKFVAAKMSAEDCYIYLAEIKLLSTIKSVHTLVCKHGGHGLFKYFQPRNILDEVSRHQHMLQFVKDKLSEFQPKVTSEEIHKHRNDEDEGTLHRGPQDIHTTNHGNGVVNIVEGEQNISLTIYNQYGSSTHPPSPP